MNPKFAILVCTLYERAQLYNRLMEALNHQIDKLPIKDEVVILTKIDNRQITTGAKRNLLLDDARYINAEYTAFFDDDDLPGPTYVQRQLEVAHSGKDCGELWGQYWEHGKQNMPFHHSIMHDHWWQDQAFYYRNPNHLNAIRLELLKDIKFQDKVFGEDGNFSEDIKRFGLLKTEYPIQEIIYYYFHGQRNYAMEPNLALKRGIKL